MKRIESLAPEDFLEFSTWEFLPDGEILSGETIVVPVVGGNAKLTESMGVQVLMLLFTKRLEGDCPRPISFNWRSIQAEGVAGQARVSVSGVLGFEFAAHDESMITQTR